MADSVGAIGLDLVINQGQFNRQLNGIQNLAKKTGKMLAGAFAVKGLTNFAKDCIELGSDLTEVQNVVDVTFPRLNKQIDKFAQNAAQSFGLSETMAKKFTGTFGAMANAFGFSEKESYKMSTALTGLAGDVASFYNISQDEAFTKLKSVFSGETETLKDLGIVMTQTALDQYALANGFGKTTSAMTEQEKVALRYAFVQQQLSQAAGDFSRTSDQWANQIRILSLQFDSLKASIGQGLINLFLPIVKVINLVLGKLVTLANAFKSFTAMITGKKSTAASVSLGKTASSADKVSTSLNNATGSAGNLNKATKKVGDTAKKAAKKISGLMGFDQINRLTETSGAGTTGSQGTGGAGTGSGGAGGISAGDIDMGSLADDSTSEKTMKLGKNFDNLRKALEKLKRAFGEFSKVVTGAFRWIWENMLVPLGKWTINKLAPKLIELLAASLNVLTSVCKALQPLWQWAWDHLFKPLAKFVGNAVIVFLDLLVKGLNGLSKWIDKHQTAVQNMAIVIASFFGAFKLVTFVTKCIGPVKNAISGIKMFGKGIISFKTLFSGLFPRLFRVAGKAVAFFTSPMGIAIAVVAGLITVGILLWKNWDKIKKTKFGKFLVGIATSFKNLLKWAKKTIHPIKAIKKLWEGIKNKKAKLEAEVKEKVDGALATLKDGWESIKDKGVSLVAEAKEAATGAIENLRKGWDSIQSKVTTLEAKVKGALDTADDWWTDLKKKIVDKIGGVNAKVEAAVSLIKEKWTSIKEFVGDKVTVAVSRMRNWKDSLKKWFTGNENGTMTMWVKRKKKWHESLKLWLTGNRLGAVTLLVNRTKNWKTSLHDWIFGKRKFKIPFSLPKISLKTSTKTILGKKFTFPTGFSIKWLAQGGYVKKNTPQLAMIGDNRHQGEVVAPEDKMIAMAKKAAELSGGGNADAEVIRLLMELINLIKSLDMNVYLDGKKITKTVNEYNNADIKAGKRPILI